MGGSAYSWSLLCAFIVLSVLWKPALSEDKCSLGCKGTPTGATFLSGHKYNYAVEGDVTIFLSGADKQETSVKLLGQVSVSALGNCAYILKVQNLVISGPGGKKFGKPPGLEKAVRFTLQDGFIGSDICAEEGDTRRSLNIKRAIISLLQSGQKSGHEVDIFGVCPTDASSSAEGGAVLVHRSRSLTRCGHREHGKNDLITAVYNPSAEIKNTQILQSSLNIESKLNNGIPEKVSAIEEHLYRPFSVGENGARARVHTKLTLTGQAAGADAAKCVEPRSIIFENPHQTAAEDQSNLQSAVAAVKDTAATLATEANSKSAGLFAQLVIVLRATNKADLDKVYQQVKGNKLEKRVFLDGLVRAGTGPSIEVCIELLKGSELSALEQKIVFLSFGNARHVSDDAVKAIASLLDNPKLPKEVYLGIGALASAYCRAHNCHTGKSEGIIALSQKLGSKLNCKVKGKVQEDYVVAALKGIRNIRHLEDSIIDKVIHCATDNGVRARVRVAALEAFKADSCSAKIKKTAINLMKNRQLDSEIRIKAYLAAIDCPCGKVANEIKTLLDSEPVHQVGRFITSSLRHIRASTNPDKQLARQHFANIGTPNKFNIDDRKYSFYREASYNVDALGIGGNVEETVIFSQDSWLPRSASLNLTTEVFGHSLNVLEVGARQGNLDRVIEHFLGPKSMFRSDEPQEIYDKLSKKIQEVQKKVEGKVRGRRSVKTDIDNFDKHVKAESEPFDNELDMDIYVKLFGTDAIFLSLGDDKGFDYNNVLDQILKYVDTGINQAKHFQQEIRSHLLFMDAELAYATSTGFPLKLKLLGSATGRFEVSTNIDIRQIMKDPRNAKLDFKLVPSTDIEIAGLFLVDADVVSTGIKVITNLHSSTGGHLIAKVLEHGQGFDLQLGLPIDKQEIITASNDLVYFTAEKGHKAEFTPLKTDAARKDYSGCFDQLSGVLGLTLCGEVSVPFSVSGPEAQASIQKFIARYPLTGAMKLRLRLEKNDLRGYHVKGILKQQNNRNSFELLFEAEGSKNRKTALSGEFVNTDQEKSLSLALDSPIKVLHGQIALYMKPNEYAAVVRAKMDTDEYFARAGFNVQGNEKRTVFKPMLEYLLPGGGEKKSLKIDGQVIREIQGTNKKFKLEGIKVFLPNNELVDIDGTVALHERGFESDIKAKKAEHNMMLSASIKDHDGKMEFRNTLNPHINFKIVGHSENQEGNFHNDIDLYYSGDLNNQQNRVTLNQLLKYNKKSAEDFGLITKNKFQIHALPVVVKLDAEVDPKKVDVEIEGQYVDKKGEFDLEARTQTKKPGDYSVKVVANLDKRGFEALAKRDVVSAEKSNLENYIVIKDVGKCELSGVVLHKMTPDDVNVGAIGHLKISGGGKNEDIKFDIGAIQHTDTYSSHIKVTRSKGELVDFLLKLNKGANPNGQLKLVLKDAIAANGQFKVTDADGKGNGVMIIDFKTAQRKIKGDVKFVMKKPVYNADVDLFLNFEKDNADKIHLSTHSKCQEKLVDSKNKLDYAGKKFEVNLHKDGVLEKDGKLNVLGEIVLPNERMLSIKLDREMATNDGVSNGHGELVLTNADKRGGPATVLTYKGKISNTNVDKDLMNYEGQLILKLKDGKNLDNTFYFKGMPQGDKLKYEFKSDVSGSLMPKPASLLMSTEFTNPDVSLIDGLEKYRVKASYGSDIGLELDSTVDTKIMEQGDKKFQEDTTIQVRLPFEKAHDIKLVSNVLFLLPVDKDFVVDYSVSHSGQVNADVYKMDASGKLGKANGHCKVKVLVPHVDPFSLEGNYKINDEGARKVCVTEVKTNYGKGKSASVGLTASTSAQEHSLAIRAHTPNVDKLKKLELTIVTKTPSIDSYSGSVIVDADGRVYKSDLMVVYSKAHPLFDVKYTSPSTNKQARIYVKGNSLSSNQGRMEIKIENIRDLSLDATVEGSIQKDDVALKMSANSEKLGLKNYKVDISSKDAGSGKRLEFHATNDNKNILSGSTSYISKQEDQKTIIEGSGSIKVKEEQKSATFKYIRTILTEGNEQGVETFVNVAIGERSYVAESRLTNMEYKTSYVYCEEKKQCAHVELNSKLSVPQQGVLEHKVSVDLDLRKLGFAPEFGLEARSELSQQHLPQYTLHVHVNKHERKYHLHVYSTPEHGKFPAGIIITLPQRVLALESQLNYPTKGLPFPMKGELSLNLDKNKPQMKATVRMLIDAKIAEKQYNANAEFGFSHPKLGKETTLKFRGNLQHNTEHEIRFESSSLLSCDAGDREAKIHVEASPIKIKVYVDTPIVKVIDLEGSTTLKDNLQQANLQFSLLQSKPVQMVAIVKEFKYFEFTSSYTEAAQRKLSVIGHIDPDKRMDLSVDIVLPNEKKNIVHGAVYLQDNLVKTDYGVSKDNFNYYVNAVKNDVKNLGGRIEGLGEKANAEFKAILQKLEPNVKKLEQSYTEEIKKLTSEFSNDKVLKEISEALDMIVKFVASITRDILDVTKPIIDNLHNLVVDTAKKIQELYEKQIQGELKKMYGSVSAALTETAEGALDVAAHVAALLTDFLEKHKPELQELTNVVAEIFKDLTRLVVAQLKEIRALVGKMVQDITQQIKDMPIVGMIQEKIKELAVPESIIGLLSEAHNAIRVVLPTEEIKAFADSIAFYVQRKLRQEKVDDSMEMRKIYEKFTVALTSLIQFVRQQLNHVGVPNIASFNVLPLVSSPSQSLPGMGSLPGFSVLNQLLHGDIPDPVSLIRAYRPRSLNPLDEIPSKLRAVVVNGQHVFTFDGRHMTFPGACRYVLVHDHLDRNFTLVMQLQNGSPKALLLEDKSGTTVEIKDNGQVAVNGAAHGHPVWEKDIFAFRAPNGRIGLGTTYGLMAWCSSKLEVCYVEVSGFYLGRLRGLLGDGNNEPYDDFRLPNGKIVSSEAEFGNAYRLSSSCAQVKTPEHVHQHGALPPACEQVFGSTSPLRPLSLVLDVAPFRQACVHAVSSDAANALQQACDLARGYTALAVTGLLPAALPAACLRCSDTDTPRAVGDSYTVQLPGKQADIVVAIETTKVNEKNYKELIVPMVSHLIDNLKAKKIDDVKVHLVGITSKIPYPLLYDTDNKLKNAKIMFRDESRYSKINTIKTGYEKVDEIEKKLADLIDSLRIKLGLTNVISGYNSIMDLPLRPGAIKHFIVGMGETCQSQFFLVDFIRTVVSEVYAEQNAITHSLITVTPDLKIGGGKSPADVVGFEKDAVILVGDNNHGKGTADLRKTLEFNNPCAEYFEASGGTVYPVPAGGAGGAAAWAAAAAAHASARSVAPRGVQHCTCAYVDPLRVRSLCVREGQVHGRK